MIITEDFVLLNFPRTGSTFVRNALKRLYGGEEGGVTARLRELILPIDRTFSALEQNRRSQHGTYAQIPAEHRHLPVVSVMRNPFDLYVSHYELGFWRKHPPAGRQTPGGRDPGGPDLSFGQYVELMHGPGLEDVLVGKNPRADVGHLTVHFLKFFSREPARAVDALTDEYIDGRHFREDLAGVRFLHQEDLASELRRFLARVGHSPQETAFIEALPPENAARRRQGRPWPAYYSDELRTLVRRRERMLFTLFPEYDV